MNLNAKIEILDPDGKILHYAQIKAGFQKTHLRLRTRIRFNAITVTIPGRYVFRISVKGEGKEKYKNMGETHLDVKVALAKL